MSSNSNTPPTVLLIDDAKEILDWLSGFMREERPEWRIIVHQDNRCALVDPSYCDGEVNVVVCDQDLRGDLEGIDVLLKMKRHRPELYTILMTFGRDLDLAANALQAGVSEFIQRQGDDWHLRLLAMIEQGIADRVRARDGGRKCFAIMPFGAWFDKCYEDIWKKAARQANHEILRNDERPGGRPFLREIWEGLSEANVAIADLTGLKPNVMYEMGLAHGRGLHVVPITQNLMEIPSDLRHLHFIVYDVQNPRWGTRLEEDLVRALSYAVRDKNFTPW